MFTHLTWERWHLNKSSLSPRQFVCGYCGEKVASSLGFFHSDQPSACIYICSNCGLPSYFFGAMRMPGAPIGREVKNLPPDIHEVYREIRETAKNTCYTATILLARKLIMHIAVAVGATEGETFKHYVDYLAKEGYTPPGADKLLDYIRALGNEKNHEIKLGEELECQRIIKLVESLLYFVYELKGEFEDPAE